MVHVPAGKLLKVLAAVIAVALAAAGSAVVASQYLAKPGLSIDPGTALSGNPVRVAVTFPFGTAAGDFRILSLNYGDGNSTALASSEHIYQKPGVYNVTLTYSRNGETGRVASAVRILPSYYLLPAMRYGDSASYSITNGSLTADNPYGIFSGNYTYGGLNASITIDSVRLTVNGTSEVRAGNTSINSADGMGFRHDSYEISQTVSLNGSGFAIGFAAGTALNVSLAMRAALRVTTFCSADNNATVSQTTEGSISLNAGYGGLNVPILGNLSLSALAYGYIGNGTLSQILWLNALSRTGIFSLTSREMARYVSHVPQVLETGLSGSYGGYLWNATAMRPSPGDTTLNITVEENGTFSRTLTMDELSPYPLLSDTAGNFALNGTRVDLHIAMKRTAFADGREATYSVENSNSEYVSAVYSLWNSGSRLPAVSSRLLKLNLSTAYSVAVNATGLGAFLQANPAAVFISGTYNFTQNSWYFTMGNLSDGAGYSARVAYTNGTFTVSGAATAVSVSAGTAQGDSIITLDSAIALLNSSSVRNYFFNGSAPSIARITYAPSQFLPLFSLFLPPAPPPVPLSIFFYAANGSMAAFDALNGQMMFFLES
jgi:hypothetical protein